MSSQYYLQSYVWCVLLSISCCWQVQKEREKEITDDEAEEEEEEKKEVCCVECRLRIRSQCLGEGVVLLITPSLSL